MSRIPPPPGAAAGPGRPAPTGTIRVPRLREFVGRRFAVRGPLIGWMVFERIGGLLAYLSGHLRVSPSFVTALSGAAGIAGSTLFAVAGDLDGVLLAGGVLLFSYSLDCADGQLARATGRTSASGAWLDVATDATVLAFMSVGLTVALMENGLVPVVSLLVAGAYGASRTISLLTASRIRDSGAGGLRLTGPSALLRTVYVALTDTPTTYLVLCATRLSPRLLMSVVIALTLLTALQTIVSAKHFFASDQRNEARDSAVSRAPDDLVDRTGNISRQS